MSRDHFCVRCHRQRALGQIELDGRDLVCVDVLDCLEHMSDRELMALWEATSNARTPDIEARLRRLIARLHDQKKMRGIPT